MLILFLKKILFSKLKTTGLLNIFVETMLHFSVFFEEDKLKIKNRQKKKHLSEIVFFLHYINATYTI